MFRVLALAAAAALIAGSASAQTKIVMGNVSSLSSGPIYIAIEKGWFTQAGIDLEIQQFQSSTDMAALLATNRLQIGAGAISVNFFNSLEQGFAVKLIGSRNTSPSFHNLLLRPDLADTVKKPADLKGRSIASNGRGSVTTYEVGKIVESGGLTLKDIELKIMGFGQMPVALTNKAVDAALMIPPLMEATVQKGMAVKWIWADDVIKAQPVVIAAKQVNTDWAAKNEAALYAFMEVIMRGVRAYCDAYHHGPNRAEVVGYLAKHSGVNDPALIENMEWGSRDPDARVFESSVLDIQDYYFQEKLIAKKFTIAEMVDDRFRAAAAKKLGQYQIARDDGKAGCRYERVASR